MAAPVRGGIGAPVVADVDAEHRERVREGVTMALYIGLSLLAVILALPPQTVRGGRIGTALPIGLTSLSLILAHQLAFRLSSRLLQGGRLTRANLELLGAQLLGGAAVTMVAVAPVLLVGGPAGVLVCELLLLALIAGVGYRTARSVPVSRLRALVHVSLVVALTLAVIALKSAVTH